MSQIRFNIGVPRGGSAARSAEDGSGRRPLSVRPQGGSAARMAEERNRLEAVPARQSVSIGLRAKGGRAASDVTPSGTETVASATVTRRRSESAPQTISSGPQPPVVPRSAESIAEQSASSQPPITVAARIQSLAKSLFLPGGSSTKPS